MKMATVHTSFNLTMEDFLNMIESVKDCQNRRKDKHLKSKKGKEAERKKDEKRKT